MAGGIAVEIMDSLTSDDLTGPVGTIAKGVVAEPGTSIVADTVEFVMPAEFTGDGEASVDAVQMLALVIAGEDAGWVEGDAGASLAEIIEALAWMVLVTAPVNGGMAVTCPEVIPVIARVEFEVTVDGIDGCTDHPVLVEEVWIENPVSENGPTLMSVTGMRLVVREALLDWSRNDETRALPPGLDPLGRSSRVELELDSMAMSRHCML